jgi:hypothetical protein
MKILRATTFGLLFIVGFLVSVSPLVLVRFSQSLPVPIQGAGYPFGVFVVVVLITLLIGVFLRKWIGFGLITGTVVGTL